MTDILERLRAFPRATLVSGPTPIDVASRLGEALGLSLLIKRDDCTGLAFGGNKTRQLEFYFGKALEQGADTILITGATQSNYVRLAVAAAARLGMAAHVQLEERVPDMDAVYHGSGNVLLDDLLGATRYEYPDGEDEAGADAAVHALADRLRADGAKPYVIPLAPDNPPLGALGYVVAAAELVEQMPDLSRRVDAVVVASGSSFTHAGLLYGLRALGQSVPVHGICVRRDAAQQAPRVAQKCAEVAALLDAPAFVQDGDVHVYDGVLAPGYGRLNDATFEAMTLAARLEGLILDPTYTAKTMAGLIAQARDGTIAAGSTVLFIHTGGTPALFAYAPELSRRLAAARGEN
jgi:D-cysteine desulfhydrase family pyridoxal phosphate-dependent enzyme